MNDIPTPRTDAETRAMCDPTTVSANFARELERELHHANAIIEAQLECLVLVDDFLDSVDSSLSGDEFDAIHGRVVGCIGKTAPPPVVPLAVAEELAEAIEGLFKTRPGSSIERCQAIMRAEVALDAFQPYRSKKEGAR